MLNIRVLQASYGDSIIISYGNTDKHYILVDGGCGRVCYRDLCKFMEQIDGSLDLLVLTHIDFDHISGILQLFENKPELISKINRIWFNFGEELQNALCVDKDPIEIYLDSKDTKVSWKQGENLEVILKKIDIQRDACVKAMDTFCIAGMKITILSPNIKILQKFAEQEDKEKLKEKRKNTKISGDNDYAKSIDELEEMKFEGNVTLTNQSSIALLLEYEEKKLLMLGDAEANIVIESLKNLGYSEDNRLHIDYFKISHHASRHNTNNELIKMINCNNYIISTYETSNGRPSKECLSRIIKNTNGKVNFYCNYDLNIKSIFTDLEIKKYGMNFILTDENGIIVKDI